MREPHAENRSVRETEALRPALRGDLQFTFQEGRGERWCVIEDPSSTRFHRVGLREYCFLKTLDGTRTVATLLAQQACAARGESFSEAEAMQILHWAKANHLLTLEAEEAPSERVHGERAWRALSTWLNPLSIRVPLGRPDAFFRHAAVALRPLCSWFGLLVWCATLLVGASQLAPEWKRFTAEAGSLLARDNWIWIFLGWVGLKTVHEFAHGLVCRSFGAPVREVGIIFVLGLPMGYVDATGSLAIPAKWPRMAIAAAGLAAEFWVAALGAILWVHTPPGPLHTFAHNVIITGTVVTLFFNANPLMRYDGYFLLSDWLEMPNLSTRGRQWVQRAGGWLLLGARSWRPEPLRSREDWLVAGYGVSAWVWQWLIIGGLIMGAAALLHGGGMIFALVAAAGSVAVPIWRFLVSLRSAVVGGASSTWRLAWRAAAFAGVIGAALFLPWQRSVSSPGVVELPETEILRAECAGFVTGVLVRDGECVTAGQTLLQLTNEEISSQLEKTRLELAQQELKARLAYTREDVATFQAEQAKAEALRRSFTEQMEYVATLTVKAPFAGRVTNRHLDQLRGSFLHNGEELLRLGRAAGAEVKIAVSERQEPHFREALGRGLDVRVVGRSGRLAATLDRVDGHASREVAWPALTALAGGPIPLRRGEASGTASADRGDRKPEYELAEPHFTATARIEQEAGLFPGETALVRFRSSRRETLWAEMQSAIGNWVARFTAG